MASITSPAESFPIDSESAYHRLIHAANMDADLTASFLAAADKFAARPHEVTAAFVMELGAVMLLREWEQSGLRPHIDADLPTYCSAATQIAKRTAGGPDEFSATDLSVAAPIFMQILSLWFGQLAWEGRTGLGADIFLGELNEEQLLDAVADFLWSHRHDLPDVDARCEKLPQLISNPIGPVLAPDYELLTRFKNNDEG